MLTQNIRKNKGLLALEWIIIATVMVIGLGFGLAAFRNMLIIEYGQTASSAANLRPEFSYTAIGAVAKNGSKYTAGSSNTTTDWTEKTGVVSGKTILVKSVSSTKVDPTTFSLESSN